MSNNAMEAKVRELVELKKMAAELSDEITAIEDEIKAVMGDEEVLTAGPFKVLWTKITSQRFDTQRGNDRAVLTAGNTDHGIAALTVLFKEIADPLHTFVFDLLCLKHSVLLCSDAAHI